MTCQELDQVITRFVDGEIGEAECVQVRTHLQHCAGCRVRVETESAAKHLLNAHAAAARTMGVQPPWRPRVFRLGRPVVPARPALILLVTASLAGLTALWLRPAPVMAIGVVSDSHCQQDHRRLMIRGERECTLGCVRAGAEFVLVTETQVYRLRNQQFPELAAMANARVKVEGSWDGDRLVIARLTSASFN